MSFKVLFASMAVFMFAFSYALEDLEREEDVSPGKGPQIIANPSYKICGVFILCERAGSFPTARLFTSTTTSVYTTTTGSCNTRFVSGTATPPGTRLNHACLWPYLNEEFGELCTYYERQHACTSGTVHVKRGGVTIYSCNAAFDAHTVQFCMYRTPRNCCRIHILQKPVLSSSA